MTGEGMGPGILLCCAAPVPRHWLPFPTHFPAVEPEGAKHWVLPKSLGRLGDQGSASQAGSLALRRKCWLVNAAMDSSSCSIRRSPVLTISVQRNHGD
jgi:hypothetical protein